MESGKHLESYDVWYLQMLQCWLVIVTYPFKTVRSQSGCLTHRQVLIVGLFTYIHKLHQSDFKLKFQRAVFIHVSFTVVNSEP